MEKLSNIGSYIEKGIFTAWGITLIDILPILNFKFLSLVSKDFSGYLLFISIICGLFTLVGTALDFYHKRKINKLKEDIEKEKRHYYIMENEISKLLKNDRR